MIATITEILPEHFSKEFLEKEYGWLNHAGNTPTLGYGDYEETGSIKNKIRKHSGSLNCDYDPYHMHGFDRGLSKDLQDSGVDFDDDEEELDIDPSRHHGHSAQRSLGHRQSNVAGLNSFKHHSHGKRESDRGDDDYDDDVEDEDEGHDEYDEGEDHDEDDL